MRHIFIVNPTAGKSGDQQDLAERIRALGLESEIVYTAGPGHARQLAREAGAAGQPARLYACGGDGTLNEVVNGAAGFGQLAVTNVPLGTGNDFLRIFGPRFRAGFSDLAALSRGPQADFDLMDCNGLLGIGVICAGVDARIAADVHRYKALPLVSGTGAYGLSLLVNVLFKGICIPMRTELGGRTYDGETAILCICNGRYYGGGFMPVGDAMPDDGVLDMLLVPKISRTTFFRFVGPYSKGSYRNYPHLIRDYHGQSVTFSADRPITVVVDGEVMRDTRFTVRLSEQTIPFFYPGDLDYSPKKPR